MKGARAMKLSRVRIPDDLRDWVERGAENERRSFNSHVVALLEQAKQYQESRAASQK